VAEKRSAEKGRDEGDSSTVENMMDNESVKDLGDTTDFLNMVSHQPNSVLYILWRFHTEVITKVSSLWQTHVMKMDPSYKTLTLSPVQKVRCTHSITVNQGVFLL
jgi:hypothetical protein